MMLSMSDIMIDIETLGQGADAVIASVGAVRFDVQRGELGAKFYARVHLEQPGRVFDADTVCWWMLSDDAARLEIAAQTDRVTLEQVLIGLRLFCLPSASEVRVWSKGPSFDVSILEHAYRQYGQRVPWRYSRVRDVRTILWLVGDPREDAVAKAPGKPIHNALEDAEAQALDVCAAYRLLKVVYEETV